MNDVLVKQYMGVDFDFEFLVQTLLRTVDS